MKAVPTMYAIDFGTSNSLLAAASPERVFAPIALDPRANDPTVLRSILFFPDSTRCFYGSDAITEYVEHGMHGRLIRSIKKHLPSRSFIGTFIEQRPMNLEDLVGAFLGEMRRRADRFFGASVERVLLGRPARFSRSLDDDRFGEQRLERAARIAGFKEVHFCPEPVAAARDFRDQLDRERLVLVGDFGGGTSDYTVVRMRPEGYDPSDVLAVGGVSVAGDALDGAIMRRKVAGHFGADVTYRVPLGSNVLTMPKHLVEKLCSPADVSLLQERHVMSFLRDVQRWSLGDDDRRRMDQLFTLVEDTLGFHVFESIERAKRELSGAEHAEVVFEYPTIDVREAITRVEFERVTAAQTESILAALDETLGAARVTPSDIDLVCCTGGTAMVPHIARALRARFGAAKMRALTTFHSVVHGLAERAQAL